MSFWIIIKYSACITYLCQVQYGPINAYWMSNICSMTLYKCESIVLNVVHKEKLHMIMLPLFFIHGFLVSGTVLLWWNRRTHLPTNVLDATLDLAAARGCLSEDTLNGRDAISVSVTASVHILQPGRRQGVLLGRHLLVELDEEGQHALPDLQDLGHQLWGCAWRDPACWGAFRPDDLGGFSVAAVDYLLELPPALRYEAEHLSFTQILRNKEFFTYFYIFDEYFYVKQVAISLEHLFLHEWSNP